MIIFLGRGMTIIYLAVRKDQLCYLQPPVRTNWAHYLKLKGILDQIAIIEHLPRSLDSTLNLKRRIDHPFFPANDPLCG